MRRIIERAIGKVRATLNEDEPEAPRKGLRPRGKRHLSDEQIREGKHRGRVGGKWDEIGPLQRDFLKSQGLNPHHKLLDVGCGALRGGVRYVEYLDSGNYYGMDIEPTLLKAGRHELELAGLTDKNANLLVTDSFEVGSFDTSFDYAIAVSLFTHMNLNQIGRCLSNVQSVLKSGATFYASFFEVDTPVNLTPVVRGRRDKPTQYDADPYHYAFEELAWMASNCNLQAEWLGDWGHHSQHMAAFHRV